MEDITNLKALPTAAGGNFLSDLCDCVNKSRQHLPISPSSASAAIAPC